MGIDKQNTTTELAKNFSEINTSVVSLTIVSNLTTFRKTGPWITYNTSSLLQLSFTYDKVLRKRDPHDLFDFGKSSESLCISLHAHDYEMEKRHPVFG